MRRGLRRGYGVNLGQGYKNMLPFDSMVHTLSAKGVKSYNYDLSAMSGYQRKGLIKELAGKVHQGVDWAVEWEKEHLPAQKDWVQKEFQSAKSKLKDFRHRAKHEDISQVRDELDTNDDGVQDIDMSELNEVNQDIREDLEDIDLDDNQIPDYTEEQPLDYQQEFTAEPEETFSPIPFPPTGEKTSPKREEGGFISSLVPKTKEFVGRKMKEKMDIKDEIMKMTDAQLKEKSKRSTSGFFGFGADPYQKELFRRIDKDKQLKFKIKEIKIKPVTETGGGLNLGSIVPLPM